jgi:hypothetical protein
MAQSGLRTCPRAFRMADFATMLLLFELDRRLLFVGFPRTLSLFTTAAWPAVAPCIALAIAPAVRPTLLNPAKANVNAIVREAGSDDVIVASQLRCQVAETAQVSPNQCGFSVGGPFSGFGALWGGAWRCSICFC